MVEKFGRLADAPRRAALMPRAAVDEAHGGFFSVRRRLKWLLGRPQKNLSLRRDSASSSGFHYRTGLTVLAWLTFTAFKFFKKLFFNFFFLLFTRTHLNYNYQL